MFVHTFGFYRHKDTYFFLFYKGFSGKTPIFDKIISIIDNFDNDIDMKDDQVYYDIKQLIVLFNEIQLLYSSHNTFKPEIDELFEILELIV